jgi:hypothetical protein
VVFIKTPVENSSSGHYKEQADRLKAEALSTDIDSKLSLLKASSKGPRADLSDLKAVEETTFLYMRHCQVSGSFPTVLGLAVSLGYSRQGLNKYIRLHPESQTTHFLETVKDTFADILCNSSLFRNADAATSIFILKNCAGFVDRLEIEPVQPTNPLGEEPDQRAIEARLAEIIIDDD